ncbi:MAG: twin-arginine translocation signal domain-containing protein [Acidobacteria bacterium]|nr:twin-arginine translocation signal domain-containing protein [Acidobacteriota bacterium]
MSVTRRSFLKSGAITVLTAGIALNVGAVAFGQEKQGSNPALDFQIPFQAKQSQTFYFNRETFKPYVGGIFRARAGKRSIQMTLTNVRDCTPSPKANLLTKKSRSSDCFALEFSTSGKLTDLTTIYDIEHAALGTFTLFMTRRDGPRGNYFYEAVFNHAL